MSMIVETFVKGGDRRCCRHRPRAFVADRRRYNRIVGANEKSSSGSSAPRDGTLQYERFFEDAEGRGRGGVRRVSRQS